MPPVAREYLDMIAQQFNVEGGGQAILQLIGTSLKQ
jgi:hypothetical protein